ncbi:MAG: hypothetical protein ACI8W8_003796 [Rhodothermales bacterium]|jgi:hypothetical protein
MSRSMHSLVITLFFGLSLSAATVLVEAEGFGQLGGWKLDTQAIEAMGSPYLLAHGLGRPVDDASTELQIPQAGTYQVWVRTKDWVARWQAQGAPGRFQLLIDGKPLDATFGTEGAEWHWQDGGTVKLAESAVSLTLHDLTGFDGRCDAIMLTTEDATPSNDSKIFASWRNQSQPTEEKDFDLVVVGGGYAGVGAAISAARMGCKVALIQNRSVLGGNGSSEVRVWAMGNIKRGKYPRIGEIIEEFADSARKSPGTYEEFGDAKKEELVRAERNIQVFLNHHAFKVETDQSQIRAVHAFDTRSSTVRRFAAPLFADCTGHATIGHLAGANAEITPKGRMGMSNMWRWAEGKTASAFPETPWALDLDMKDFPYPRSHHGQWFWESGYDKDPLGDAEGIRDWNLRAVYGAFNAMKNRDERHSTAYLEWVAYIGGPRESRRLLGDVLLTEEDIVSKRDFPDGCVPSTWSIDLHYPKAQYAAKFPDNPFISIAKHGKGVDRNVGYPVPYRTFYSRNIDNLFMAGRCVSVTHEALGTVRVMKTCGMMGEVVGRAASICRIHNCLPRGVYENHLNELLGLLQIPGKSRRSTVTSELQIPNIPAAKPPAPTSDPTNGIPVKSLPGIIIDDHQAKKSGHWSPGAGLPGYVGSHYLYSSSGSISFSFAAPEAGNYDIRLSYRHHENRGDKVPIGVELASGKHPRNVNMRKTGPLPHGFISLGVFPMAKGESCKIVVGSSAAGGYACADAVQAILIK